MYTNTKFVSIIIPCRNEEKFIASCIDSILANDYSHALMEIIIVDGMSTDGTLDIIHNYIKKHPFINLIINSQKIVPHALNAGIKASRGDVIIRIDAHCDYPTNYISTLVHYLFQLNADNVGGIWINTPPSETVKAKAMAIAIGHPLGVGNAQYRIGSDKIMEVDTVPFGCYKREVFDKIGFFDEELIRNQDDEFNARLIKNGGKIFLIPDVQIVYYVRDSLTKIIRMFYQYGLFKPLVNIKVGKPATYRQFAPLILLSYLYIYILILPFHFLPWLVISLPLMLYGFAILFVSLKLSITYKRCGILFFLPITFAAIHFSYGWGYMQGILKFLILKKNVKNVKVLLSR